MRLEVREQEAPRQCPYCRAGLDGDDATACGACGTAYHRECAAEIGTCGTLGCGGAFTAPAALTCRHCRQAIPETESSWYCHLCSATYHRDHGAEGRQCPAAPCGGVLMFREARTAPTPPVRRRRRLYIWENFKYAIGFGAAAVLVEALVDPTSPYRVIGLTPGAVVFGAACALSLVVVGIRLARGRARLIDEEPAAGS